MSKLYDLASTHEWNLAYNESDPVRAIAGSVLAGQVVDALEAVVEKKKEATPFTIQFGAYGTFMALFGLAQLPAASSDFYGICDYSSSMSFELVTNATNPKPEDISVRFFFSNGTATDDSYKSYPLFGQDKTTLSWADFKSGMDKFAIRDSDHWCDVCGNTDGQCAKTDTSDDAGASEQSNDHGSGISKPVAGVIGALVTLVVILALEAAIMLIGGFRLVKKSTLTKISQETVTPQKA